MIPWKQLPLINPKEKHHCNSEPRLAGNAGSEHENINPFLEGDSGLCFVQPEVLQMALSVASDRRKLKNLKLCQCSFEMTREEHPSSASSHAAAPQDRAATATVVREDDLGPVLCPRGQGRHSSNSSGLPIGF